MAEEGLYSFITYLMNFIEQKLGIATNLKKFVLRLGSNDDFEEPDWATFKYVPDKRLLVINYEAILERNRELAKKFGLDSEERTLQLLGDLSFIIINALMVVNNQADPRVAESLTEDFLNFLNSISEGAPVEEVMDKLERTKNYIG